MSGEVDGCGVRHVDQSSEMNPLWETLPVPVSVEETLAEAPDSVAATRWPLSAHTVTDGKKISPV